MQTTLQNVDRSDCDSYMYESTCRDESWVYQKVYGGYCVRVHNCTCIYIWDSVLVWHFVGQPPTPPLYDVQCACTCILMKQSHYIFCCYGNIDRDVVACGCMMVRRLELTNPDFLLIKSLIICWEGFFRYSNTI